jgi:hypothetical protein
MAVGQFIRRLALETPDGSSVVFNAPVAWEPQTLYVIFNGQRQWRGFSFIGGTQVQFDTPPSVGDTIEFLYNSP